MVKFKLIILNYSNERKSYNAILYRKKFEQESTYFLEEIRKFEENEKKLFEKDFEFDLSKNNDFKNLILFFKEELKLNAIKVDLYSKNVMPFFIANNEIEKLKNNL